MPGREARTNVVIEIGTKGYEKALRQTLGINEAALSSLKKQAGAFGVVQKEIDGYQGKLKGLAKTQLDLSRKMETMGEKGSAAYSELKDKMRDVTREARDVERVIKNLEKAYRGEADAVKTLGNAQKKIGEQRQQDTRQARGAFLQGAIQAGAPGMAPLFMQRGPGMRRQAMGMMAGGMARRGLGGLAQMPFTGMGGLQQAISAIPGGGLIAGSMGAAAGYAGQALQFQRQRVETAPFLREGDELAGRRKKLAAFRKSTAYRPLAKEEYRKRTGKMVTGGLPLIGWRGQVVDPTTEYGQRLIEERERVALEPGGLGEGGIEGVSRPFEEKGLEETEEQYRTRLIGKKREEGILRRRVRTAQARTIGGMGMKYRGLGRQEAEQEAAAIMQTAGGVYRGGAEQGEFMGTAMAARTRFGVGPEATGAFQAGARRGGLVGGRGRGAEALTEALGDAVKLGLEGSEINTYMQMMAQGIQRFEQTGIPFNKESISAMGQEFSKAGIAGTRAARIAGGVQQYVSGIGQRGIRGGLDIMAMQAFGGYTGGGGAEELERSMIQTEEMGGKLREGGVGGIEPGGAMAGFMKKIMAMRGGGAGGRFFLREQLGKMGIQMGTREMSLLGKKLAGGKFTAEEQGFVDREAASRGTGSIEAGKIATPAKLMAEAATLIPASLRKQAAIANKQLEAGDRTLAVVQKLEKSAVNMADSVGYLAQPGGVVDRLATGMEDFTAALSKKLATGEAPSMFDIIKMLYQSGVG